MKVFISWSGELSKKVAEAFNEWLPQVIQSIETFFSPEIQKGKRWQEIISSELEDCSYGIIFLTPKNLHEDWILFESGALSKIVKESNVATFLINLSPTDVKEPLSIFQATESKKEDVLKLLKSINGNIKDGKLKPELLISVFEKWWPDFETKLSAALKSKSIETAEQPRRNDGDILREVLQLTRGIQSDISKLSSDKFRNDLIIKNIIPPKEKNVDSTDKLIEEWNKQKDKFNKVIEDLVGGDYLSDLKKINAKEIKKKNDDKTK